MTSYVRRKRSVTHIRDAVLAAQPGKVEAVFRGDFRQRELVLRITDVETGISFYIELDRESTVHVGECFRRMCPEIE